ncbi:MAG: hypothetical protein KZQ85_07190 [Candidatus Thiodiazotropha sp. (ex Myrtea sp. 'scaly one' KF741663)]|nr:hypothetical protein [Candidatus Thiodiazotropha sp. (ex Myrtea sp. 'scaly one' KF741663)]
MDINCYSRRLLSPFHGAQQVLSIPGGIAESLDGHVWKLYVADERIVSHTGLSEVRYGDWNSREGRQRSRIRGTSSSELIETVGEQLIQALECHAHQVPFPAVDLFECWLLDGENRRPLALLNSTLRDHALSAVDSPAWHPGGASGRGFHSEAGETSDLAALIRQTAGKVPSACWYKREKSGCGIDAEGTRIPAEIFPPLLLQSAWSTPEQQRMVSDYLDWQAPWLLQLELDTVLRKQLEKAAWKRPLETSRVYRLFPKVFDAKGLTVTRVKARMLQEKPSIKLISEPFYPFVNE